MKAEIIKKNGDLELCFLTAQIDPPQLLKAVPRTLWPSFLIGKSSARGRGIGKQSMIWCEELAKEKNCKRVEIGGSSLF